jgi:hypothetical protein
MVVEKAGQPVTLRADVFSAVTAARRYAGGTQLRRNPMAHQSLEDVTGIGKGITIRNTQTGKFTVGRIEDEVSISDGEERYFIQRIGLAFDVAVEGDETRCVYRIGYYTRRRDARLCLGSQLASEDAA